MFSPVFVCLPEMAVHPMKKNGFRIFALCALVAAMILSHSVAFSADRGLLYRYHFADTPEYRIKLPSSLREISGLAVSEAGKLFAHDDELSTVFQLDPRSGKVLKKFHVITARWYGKGRIEDDFEDIAVAGNRFFLVTSSGTLYEFREGKNEEKVQAVVYKTGLGKSYEVEGLCYDPVSDALLLSCKKSAEKKGFRKTDERPVFSFPLASMTLRKSPRFIVDARTVAASAGKKGFKPSAISRHPVSGTFFLLSAESRLIAEIDAGTGSLLNVFALPAVYHPQPEGMVVMPDNTLLISSEDILQGTVSAYSMRSK